MIDHDFVSHLLCLDAKGKDALPEMREFLRMQGGMARLLALAQLGVTKAPRKAKTKQPALPGTEFPDWWPIAAWEGYMAMRKAKGVPPTERAIELLVRAVTDLRVSGSDPAAVLDRSTVNGWTDVYPLQSTRGAHAAGNSSVVAFEQTSLDGWIGRLRLHLGQSDDCPPGTWSQKWGAKPGEQGCKVPEAALAAVYGSKKEA